MPLPELEELYTLYRTDLYRYLCYLTILTQPRLRTY